MKKDKKKEIEEMSKVDAMEQLANIINDTPRNIKLGGHVYEIKALRMGTQMLIAQESIKIMKNETSNMSDIIKQFSMNIPSVVRCLTLAILNDKEKINDKDEYQKIYDTIMWETDQKEWLGILLNVMGMLSLDCFFDTTNALAILREMALGRKMKKEELKK